jgi:hypothetical protein
VFTLVVAEVMDRQFNVGPVLFGGLVIYTLGTTLLPGLVLRTPLPALASRARRTARRARARPERDNRPSQRSRARLRP